METTEPKITPKKTRYDIKKSEHFPVIMKKYEAIGRSISIRKFHREYVLPIDPAITLRQWTYFMQKINKQIQIKSDALIKRIVEKEVSETDMEQSAVKKILAIADLTLDEVVKNPDLLAAVPLSDRMQWLFNSMKARDSRMVALTKVQQESRKTSMYEDMFQGAQYGAIEASEVKNDPKPAIEQKTAPAKPEVVKTTPIDPNPAPPKPIPANVVEFAPEDL